MRGFVRAQPDRMRVVGQPIRESRSGAEMRLPPRLESPPPHARVLPASPLSLDAPDLAPGFSLIIMVNIYG